MTTKNYFLERDALDVAEEQPTCCDESMAAQVAPSSLRPRGNESESEELSDSEIQRLLKEAEARLRAAAEAKTETPHPPTDYVGSGTAKRTPLPTLKVGFKDEPYIHNHNGIAQADPARIVGQEQRKLADILRAVESKDKSKKTVSSFSAMAFIATHMMTSIPKHPMQISGSF